MEGFLSFFLRAARLSYSLHKFCGTLLFSAVLIRERRGQETGVGGRRQPTRPTLRQTTPFMDVCAGVCGRPNHLPVQLSHDRKNDVKTRLAAKRRP